MFRCNTEQNHALDELNTKIFEKYLPFNFNNYNNY